MELNINLKFNAMKTNLNLNEMAKRYIVELTKKEIDLVIYSVTGIWNEASGDADGRGGGLFTEREMDIFDNLANHKLLKARDNGLKTIKT